LAASGSLDRLNTSRPADYYCTLAGWSDLQHYGESADDKELEAISKLYAGFVFRKGVNASRH